MSNTNISFHDPDQFEWVNLLRNAYPDIKREWERWPRWLRAARSRFHHGNKLEYNDSKWDVVPLMNRNKPLFIMRWFFPKTMQLIDQIPVFENLSFSVFYPGAETIKHTGWTEAIVRVHLAIDTHEDCTLHCVDQSVTLKNGEVLVFEDGKEHWAYNHSNKERTVLLFDVLKKDIGISHHEHT